MQDEELNQAHQLAQAINITGRALEIVENAIERYDEMKRIYGDKDFLVDAYDTVSGDKIDPHRLKNVIGDIVSAKNPEQAKIMAQRLSDQNISFHAFDVIKADETKGIQKPDRETNELTAKAETWFVISKEDNEQVQKIADNIKNHEKSSRVDVERLIEAAKQSSQPFELTAIQNVSKSILYNMEDNLSMPRIYSVIEHGKKCTVVMPSVYEKDFNRDLIYSIGHLSGREGREGNALRQEKYAYENKHLKRTVDDRKPFFIANTKEDGTFHEGVVIDKAGARRLVFIEDKTYCVESYKRESSMFTAQAAHLIGKYDTPGYMELSGQNIKREDIEKAKENIVIEKLVQERDDPRDIAVDHKNYLIQHYVEPVMHSLISETVREDTLSRIRNGKWHALENGLAYEAQELSKDEAEGSALTTPKTRETLRSIDLNTIDHEAFDLKDDFGYTTREELARILGFNKAEINISQIKDAKDERLDEIMQANPSIKRLVRGEMVEFYKAMDYYKDIEYSRVTPAQLEESLSIDKELSIALEQDRSLQKDSLEPER